MNLQAAQQGGRRSAEQDPPLHPATSAFLARATPPASPFDEIHLYTDGSLQTCKADSASAFLQVPTTTVRSSACLRSLYPSLAQRGTT